MPTDNSSTQRFALTSSSLDGHVITDQQLKVKRTIPEVLNQPGIRVIRERYSKKSVLDYLEGLSDPILREQYVKFHRTYPFFNRVCAGAKHHHWWVGGLADHVVEMIGYCFDLIDLYPGDFEHKLTKDDVVIACYLHDFAKIWTYELITDEDREKKWPKYLEEQVFKPMSGAFNTVDEESRTLLELARVGIVPSNQQWSAVLFAEGGWADANWGPARTTKTSETVMSHNPLAVIVSMADLYSSQILGGSIA
jgi:hypothetical protein